MDNETIGDTTELTYIFEWDDVGRMRKSDEIGDLSQLDVEPTLTIEDIVQVGRADPNCTVRVEIQ